MSFLAKLREINSTFVCLLREFSEDPLIPSERELRKFLRLVYLKPWRRELSLLTRAFGIFFNPYIAYVRQLKRDLRVSSRLFNNQSAVEIIESDEALTAAKNKSKTSKALLVVDEKKE